ncbi:hypothetical protein ACVGVM_14245 [Pseudonocardia bannensis]|uniref:Uncharacterized protein n=1 Tax=Pseudonocardia bannensis TaxID=630973 RepID=A0A848DDW2_9PSEU|nr:hypothetical protein [Pseudonocardia bannensis]
MGRVNTPLDVDPLTTVIGIRGTPYACPNIPTVDHHIAGLYTRIERAGTRFPDLVEEYWTEIDLLLDRRMWLELNAEISGAA